jgi:hypothetical protein
MFSFDYIESVEMGRINRGVTSLEDLGGQSFSQFKA